MPNKRTLAIGTKLQVPAKPAAKDKTTDDLLLSGKFDEVPELKPDRGETDAPKTKEATAAKDAKDLKAAPAVKDAPAAKVVATVKDLKDAPKASSKDTAKSPARTAVAEVSQETLDSILLERSTAEQTSTTTATRPRWIWSRPPNLPTKRPPTKALDRRPATRNSTTPPWPREITANVPDPEGRHLVQAGRQVHGRRQALARTLRPQR